MKFTGDEMVATMAIVEEKDDEPNGDLPSLNGHEEGARRA
jgi:hypothetical protein